MSYPLPLHYSLPLASPLIYGCMGLGGGWNSNPITGEDTQLANAAVDAALESGITLFDHADIYTFGKAEQVFGQILKTRPQLRSQITIQSKCGIRLADGELPQRYDFSRQWLTSSVEGILKRLGIEQLDILLLHRPDPLMDPQEVAEVLSELHASGKVANFGVSNMDRQQMILLQSALEMPLIVNQLPISLTQLQLINEGVEPQQSSSGTLEYCRQSGVQIQAWGSLCQGLFSGRELSEQPGHIHETAAKIRAMASELQTSPEAVVLAWLMRHPAKIQPVVGTTHPGRIRACAQAPEIKLSREQWYQLYVSARGEALP